MLDGQEENDNDVSDNSDVMRLSYGDVRGLIVSVLKRYEEFTLGRCTDNVIKEITTALLKDANHLVKKCIYYPMYSAVAKSVSQVVHLDAADETISKMVDSLAES